MSITIQFWHVVLILCALALVVLRRPLWWIFRTCCIFAIGFGAMVFNMPIGFREEEPREPQQQNAVATDPVDEHDDRMRWNVYASDKAERLTQECLATGAEVEPIQPYDEWVAERKLYHAQGG